MVRIGHTADTSFLGLTAARLSAAGIGIGIQAKGTTVIHRADLDGLVRMVDTLCAGTEWSSLLELRNRSRDAVSTGRQLWPAATLAEYRLALWAPADWAARVLDEDSGRFTIGPLTEVVAEHHTWAEALAWVSSPTNVRCAGNPFRQIWRTRWTSRSSCSGGNLATAWPSTATTASTRRPRHCLRRRNP